MGKLDGQVAIVTGAARGLGRAYALRLGPPHSVRAHQDPRHQDSRHPDAPLIGSAPAGRSPGRRLATANIHQVLLTSFSLAAESEDRMKVWALTAPFAFRRLNDADLQVLGHGGERVVGAREVNATAGIDHGAAARRIAAARSMSALGATGRSIRVGASRSASPSSSMVSGGISSSTGRGRPVRSCTTASRTMPEPRTPRGRACATW